MARLEEKANWFIVASQDHVTTPTAEEAHALLKGLPLGQVNLLVFELIPIGPLAPLGMLMSGQFTAASK